MVSERGEGDMRVCHLRYPIAYLDQLTAFLASGSPKACGTII